MKSRMIQVMARCHSQAQAKSTENRRRRGAWWRPEPEVLVSPDPPPLVVIVDDDEAVCDALSALLGTAGCATLSLLSPLDALDNCDLQAADCLVVDVHMPGLDGFELVRRLRAAGVYVPVIFMTARSAPGLESTARAAGGRLLLEKPFDSEALLAAICGILGDRPGTAPGA